MAVPSLILNTGLEMPFVGLGMWKPLSNEAQKAVENALDSGYRHIDTAWSYRNENEVGSAIANKIKEGKVKRGDIFLTSKLWCTFHEPKDVREGLIDSLNKLQTDYLDLFLIHFPVGFRSKEDSNSGCPFSDTDYVETWKAMELLQKEGLIRNIGVSNFNKYQINRIIKEATIVPAVNQIENHPYLMQKDLVKFCQSKGIAVTAYSPLGCRDKPSKLKKVLMEDPKVVELARRLNKTVAQVLLRFQIQRNIMVIPKSVTPSHIESNLQVFEFELSDSDMRTLESLDENLRLLPCENLVPGFAISDHQYYPFKEDYTEQCPLLL